MATSIQRLCKPSAVKCIWRNTLFLAGTPATTPPSREYGRKVKNKPEKVTTFSYSGDLRTIKEINPDTLLCQYKAFEKDLEENDVLRKLTSYEFATQKDKKEHMRQMVQDRIIELFGPDSELEQKIALRTLSIRYLIPRCIADKKNKLMKVILLKLIFGRRDMLNRLRDMDHERFEWLLRELKIRYVIPRDPVEFKGWRHNLRVATESEALAKKRAKLEDLKAQFDAEKEEFYRHKAKVLGEIEQDLRTMGLNREFLEKELVAERETLEYDKILTLSEKVKLGMTGNIDDYHN